MDVIQNHIYNDCKAFVDEKFEHCENEPTISLGLREAYVIIKALEDQQRYLNPPLVVSESLTSPIIHKPSKLKKRPELR